MMEAIIRDIPGIILFAISSVGFWLLLKKHGVPLPFAPAITCSMQIIVMYFAGLLNCLELAQIMMMATGILFFFINCRRIRGEDIQIEFLLFILISSIIAYALTLGKKISFSDDMSHWGLIVRVMLRENRLPNFMDTVISFQKYPPSTACYIYYVCKCIGSDAEGMFMFAQTFLQLAYISSLFVFVKKNRVISCALVFLFSELIMCFAASIYYIMVDTVLGTMGAVTLVYFFEVRSRFEKKNAIILMLLLGAVTLVKNSGIFYAAVIAVYMIVDSIKNRGNIGLKICTACLPFVCFYLCANCKCKLDTRTVEI